MVHRRRGLTLVEMLIALFLMAMLMAALWSLFDVYSKLFERGAAKTEQSQVARALMQVISEDLRAAIQEVQVETAGEKPKGTNVDGGSSTTRRFGLFGSEKELSIDIVQLTPSQVFGSQAEGEDTTGTGRTGSTGETDVPSAPELRTVVYRFVEPETEEDETEADFIDAVADQMKPKDPPGLIRREYTFDPVDPEEEEQKALQAAAVADPDMAEEETDDMMQIGAEEPAETLTDDFTITYAPEVLDLRFRYFDGTSWASSWDSIARKSLPVAVEVTMKVKSFDPRDEKPKTLAEKEKEEEQIDFVGNGTADEMGIDGAPDLGSNLDADLETGTAGGLEEPLAKPDHSRTYRLIVDLPTAAMHKGTKAASTSTMDRIRPASPPPMAPRRLAVPPPRRPGGPDRRPARKRPSEQWMRTNSVGER